jgi:cytochrome o ubiquinol oxidase subunit 1
MTTMFGGWLGRLNWNALQHGLIIEIGQLIMVVTALAVIGALFYFKRWKWLYKNWLTTLDPKRIGVMYIMVSFLMLFKGLSDAILLRGQQVTSVGASHGILSADHYQQIFTAHGTTMIFFVAMGLMFGLINLIVPLQIGSRDVAFPLINATSFWLFCAGMLLMNISLVLGGFAATGWLAYPPLSELAYSPGVGVDFWIWSIQIAGIGSMLSGINFLVTIIKMRAPGMSWMKLPMFSWSVLASMSLVIFAFPILTVTLALLALDRTLGTHFFTAGGGGNAMMYVNLIWAWGHPEVYILILPAFGVFSEVVATFSSKALFGYESMVGAIWAIVILSFTVWLHHFFTMGAGANVNGFFGIMTMVIAIPTGVKIFNWLFTMYRGRIRFTTPMKWFLGFVVTFTIGGVAGVMMAVPPIDFQLQNSLFLVAHFHTMVIGGVLFGYFAALTYWFPKLFGFRLNEKIGSYAFWFWLVGYSLAFIPLYILGIMGATRRLDHYSASLGWRPLFIVAGVGVVLVITGLLIQVVQVIVSYVLRSNTLDTTGDPWNGRTLEWSTVSPAPFYNFAIIPEVNSRDQFWADKHSKKLKPAPVYKDIELPKNTALPLAIGFSAFFFGFGMIWHIWWLCGLGLIGVIFTIIWRTSSEDHDYTITAAELRKLEIKTKATLS